MVILIDLIFQHIKGSNNYFLLYLLADKCINCVYFIILYSKYKWLHQGFRQCIQQIKKKSFENTFILRIHIRFFFIRYHSVQGCKVSKTQEITRCGRIRNRTVNNQRDEKRVIRTRVNNS